MLAVATREETIFLNAYLQTGARKTEIFRWTWTDDINFEQRQVRLTTRKTRDGSEESEWIPMSDACMKTFGDGGKTGNSNARLTSLYVIARSITANLSKTGVTSSKDCAREQE